MQESSCGSLHSVQNGEGLEPLSGLSHAQPRPALILLWASFHRHVHISAARASGHKMHGLQCQAGWVQTCCNCLISMLLPESKRPMFTQKLLTIINIACSQKQILDVASMCGVSDREVAISAAGTRELFAK